MKADEIEVVQWCGGFIDFRIGGKSFAQIIDIRNPEYNKPTLWICADAGEVFERVEFSSHFHGKIAHMGGTPCTKGI